MSLLQIAEIAKSQSISGITACLSASIDFLLSYLEFPQAANADDATDLPDKSYTATPGAGGPIPDFCWAGPLRTTRLTRVAAAPFFRQAVGLMLALTKWFNLTAPENKIKNRPH